MNCSLTDRPAARNVRADAFVAQPYQTEMAELEREAIAGRIKQARKEAGLSQTEMAEALDVIPRTYQNYESLKEPRTPWGLMNQIATVTGKSTEWLIHGDRPAPDLSGIAGSDQVAGVRDEFRDDVDEMKALLATQNDNLARQSKILEGIERLLARQSKILETIERRVEILDGVQGVVSEPAATGEVRELPNVLGPEPAQPRPRESERDTETTGHDDRRVHDRRQDSA